MEFKHMHLKVLLDHIEYDTSALSEETAIAQLRAAGLLNWKGLAKDVPSFWGKTVINSAVECARLFATPPAAKPGALFPGANHPPTIPHEPLIHEAVAGEYTEAIGAAGERYMERFPYAHPLPAQFRWRDLWDALRAAAAEVPRPPAAEVGETWLVSIGGDPRLVRRTVIEIGPKMVVLGQRSNKHAFTYSRERYLSEGVRFVQQVCVRTKGA